MNNDLEKIIAHDDTDDCVACRSQDIIGFSLVPAVATWEDSYQLPRHSLALHGAAGLMAFMIQNGVRRDEVEVAVGRILDDYETQMAESGLAGLPPQGTA
ncbi:MAG: hypothetical protein ACTSYE_09255 [Alphaproteobacteria bacterium]